jgi:ribonuclease P protein component
MNTFTDENRIKRKGDFDLAFTATKCALPELVVYGRLNSEPGHRLGLVVSKKVAKSAPQRNLIKRRLRECFRTQILPEATAQGIDFVVVARNQAVAASFLQLNLALQKACTKIRSGIQRGLNNS